MQANYEAILMKASINTVNGHMILEDLSKVVSISTRQEHLEKTILSAICGKDSRLFV
jgi:hypothetical protein